jgi:D-alanyl-D-alanine carboxypeptidase
MASLRVVKQKRWGAWAARFTIAFVLAIAGLSVTIAGNQAEARPVQSSIVVDAATGEIISASNADSLTYPASLTKMMTLYLLFEALQDGRVKLTDTINFSKFAAGQPATNLNVRGGDQISVETAILALVIRSANDAATAVAEHLGGTESGFARLMTAKANALGMTHTSFRNANGLPDPKQKSTARDLATLSIALIRDFPEYYGYFSKTKFKYRGVTYNGHNRLLKSYQGYDGIKTGYIRASGFNLASSAERDGRRLVVVVLGGTSPSSRDRKVADLLTDGFKTTKGTGMLMAAKAPAGGNVPKLVPAAPAPTVVAAADANSMDQFVAKALKTAETAGVKTGLIEADFELQPVQAAAASNSGAPNLIPMLKPGTRGDMEVASVVPVAKPAAKKPDAQSTTVVWNADGDYGIQVGAYSKFNAAQNAAQVAAKAEPDLLAEARIVIDSQKMNNGGKVYRARVAGLTKADAQTACRNLKAKRTDCLVLKMDNPLAMGN